MHVNYEGNELAHKEAKKGTKQEVTEDSCDEEETDKADTEDNDIQTPVHKEPDISKAHQHGLIEEHITGKGIQNGRARRKPVIRRYSSQRLQSSRLPELEDKPLTNQGEDM